MSSNIVARAVTQWVENGSHKANGSITAKSPSKRVSMVADLEQGLWSGWTPAVITGGDGFSVAASGACNFTAVALVGDLSVTDSESMVDAPAGSIRVCPSPTVDPGRYSISAPTAPGARNPAYVCVSRTVTGTCAGSAYCVFWNVEIDRGQAAAVIAKAGMHVTGVNLEGSGASQYLSDNHYLFSAKYSGLAVGAAATVTARLIRGPVARTDGNLSFSSLLASFDRSGRQVPRSAQEVQLRG